MKKRLISMILVFAMLISAFPVTAFAANGHGNGQVTSENDDLSIEGTNGFGNLLAKDLEENEETKAEAAENYPEGYSITELEIVGNTAYVTYNAVEEATLVVGVYTEDGLQLLTSGKVNVLPEETMATVTIDGEMPEYFNAEAFLLDTYDLSPLCTSYETPMYTQEMQELLASTVEDFDTDRVLNLDDDNTTNFAVYAETTKVIEYTEDANRVTVVDEENDTYIIDDADESITSLDKGDIFVYPYGENEILIVKVATITVDDSTATIIGDEMEMEDAFDYVKIEGIGDSSNMTVDDSSCGDGVTYLGLSDGTEGQNSTSRISTYAWEGGESGETALKIGIDKDIMPVDNSQAVETSINVKGTLNFSIKAGFEFYISLTRQYIKTHIDYSVGLEVRFSGKVASVIDELPTIGFAVGEFLIIGFEPEFEFSVTGKVEISCMYIGELGFVSENGKTSGLKSNPRIESEVSFEGTAFLGVDMNPSIYLFFGKVADISLKALVGVEFEGKNIVAEHEITTEYYPELKHECTKCLDITVRGKIELAVDIELLGCFGVYCDLFNYELDLAKAYFSFDYVEFGWGKCPHLMFKITASVVDGEGMPIPGAVVSVDEEIRSANGNGTAVFYRIAGKYRVTAKSDDLSDSCSVVIDEEPCKVALVLAEEEDKEDDSERFGILGTVDTEEVTDNPAVEEIIFNNNRYQLFDLSMTWTEANAYCESIGGHLVTITSAQEQAIIEELIDSGSKYQYWIGMYRNNGNLVWVTGELISYTNWDYKQPDRVYYNGMYEDYVEIFNVPNTESGSKRFKWNDMYVDNINHPNPSAQYTTNTVGFICEFEDRSDVASSTVSPLAVFGGEYSTDVTNTYTLKTASFTNLVPNEQYVLLAMKSIEVEDPLAADNLLYIKQGVADENGDLTFKYVQRVATQISYVVACGPSNKNLMDATIAFPEMIANGETQVVNPTVVHDGKTLKEGRDYIITGTVDFTKAGTYTCYIRGIHNYTGIVEYTYTCSASSVLRGDSNADGTVSNADLILVARYIVELETTLPSITNADMDGDALITNSDLVALARLIVGM